MSFCSLALCLGWDKIAVLATLWRTRCRQAQGMKVRRTASREGFKTFNGMAPPAGQEVKVNPIQPAPLGHWGLMDGAGWPMPHGCLAASRSRQSRTVSYPQALRIGRVSRVPYIWRAVAQLALVDP